MFSTISAQVRVTTPAQQQDELSPQYVQQQMGHHSIQVTVDILGHLIPGANRGAVDRLDDVPRASTVVSSR